MIAPDPRTAAARAAVALTALSALASCAAVCIALGYVTPSGVVPLEIACAALFVVGFVPLFLGQEVALKNLRTAIVLWPLFGAALAGVAMRVVVPPRVALAVAVAASLAAYLAFRRSSLAGSPLAPPRERLQRAAAFDIATYRDLAATHASVRGNAVAASPGWLIAAQLALLGPYLSGLLFAQFASEVHPQLAEPGNVVACIVAGLAYLRWYYYTIASFSYRATEGGRRAIAVLLATTILGYAACVACEAGVLLPAIHAVHPRRYGSGFLLFAALLAAVPALADAYALVGVSRLDVPRLARDGFRVGAA